MNQFIDDIEVSLDRLLVRIYKLHGDVVLDKQAMKYKKQLKETIEIIRNELKHETRSQEQEPGTGAGAMSEYNCYVCGKKVNPDTAKWIEVDGRDNSIHKPEKHEIPAEHSIGGYPVGRDCYRKLPIDK